MQTQLLQDSSLSALTTDSADSSDDDDCHTDCHTTATECLSSFSSGAEEGGGGDEPSDHGNNTRRNHNHRRSIHGTTPPPPPVRPRGGTAPSCNDRSRSCRPTWNKLEQSSPFLQQQQQAAAVARFHRSEIVTGRRLGTGGFAQVYEIGGFVLDPAVTAQCSPQQQELRLACARQPPGRYCLKHLHGERLLNNNHSNSNKNLFATALSDLVTEAAYMSRLDHPHILKLRGLPVGGLPGSALRDGEYDGYFLVTDRLTETLDEWIQRQPKRQQSKNAASSLLLETKMEYARQLADALAYLHGHRILFRDLKPQNVGVTADGRIQLFDFGLCRELPCQWLHPKLLLRPIILA